METKLLPLEKTDLVSMDGLLTFSFLDIWKVIVYVNETVLVLQFFLSFPFSFPIF